MAGRPTKGRLLLLGVSALAVATIGTAIAVVTVRSDDGRVRSTDPSVISQAPISADASEQWSYTADAALDVTGVSEIGGLTLVTLEIDDERAYDLHVDPQPAVVALDADGKQVWRQTAVDEYSSNSGNPITAVPATTGDLVYVYDGEQLRAVDLTGEVRWTLDREVMAFRQYDDTLVLGVSDPDTGIDEENTDENQMTGEVTVLDARTGRSLITEPGTVDGFTPAGALMEHGHDVQLLGSDGQIAWQADLDCTEPDWAAQGQMVVANEQQIVIRTDDFGVCDNYGDGNSELIALDPKDGSEIWSHADRSTHLLGAGPDGTIAGIRYPAYDRDGPELDGDGTLVLYDTNGEEEDIALPGVPRERADDDLFDPWDRFEAGFVDVAGSGPTYVDNATGTVVTPDLDVHQLDRGILALSTAGPYLVPKAGELTVTDWSGTPVTTVALADDKPDVWAVDQGVVTFEEETETVRLYR